MSNNEQGIMNVEERVISVFNILYSTFKIQGDVN